MSDETPEERMIRQRDDFMARGWPTGAEVAARLGSDVEDKAQYASQLRRGKMLFGVWSTQNGGTYVHPDFQFADAHTLSPHMPALLDALEAIPGFSDDPNDVKGGDPGRWRRLFWLYQPRDALSDRSLAEAHWINTQTEPPAPKDPPDGWDAMPIGLKTIFASEGLDETPLPPVDRFARYPDAVIALARRDAEDDRGPL